MSNSEKVPTLNAGTRMEDVSYLYEFESKLLDLNRRKQLVQVETNYVVEKPKELLREDGLVPDDFLYVRLIKIVDNKYTVLYDINVS
jgi:hypothetical protein